ncbi:hypothetical protein C8F04DRAFT_1390732 [Mycena alexandri]|uniref:Uncharacterized protein n=1 Tax=Mycena alexandri TaxID=1745969 RepID=A0AAD6TA42_9AGAR|nr:hypothetical protein C8F04DRAFT_1390732 [Mycena alexandri]
MIDTLLVSNSATLTLTLEQGWARIAITDGVLLYRCAVIWSSSRYLKVVIGIPAILILSTFGLGLYATFGLTVDTPAPYVLALVTNFVLLALSAGKIWRKGRQASVVLGAEARQRYTDTVEIICESSLLYFLNVLIYMIADATVQSDALITTLAWGPLAQVVNIVPMLIIVRVGIAKSLREPEPARVFYGGNTRSDRFGMTVISEDSMALKGGAKYSQLPPPDPFMD